MQISFFYCTSKNNRKKKRKKFLDPKWAKWFLTWSKEKLFFEFLFIFSFKQIKEDIPPGRRLQKLKTFSAHFRVKVKFYEVLRQVKKQNFKNKWWNWHNLVQLAKCFFSSLKKHSTLLDSAVIMMSTVHLGPVLRHLLSVIRCSEGYRQLDKEREWPAATSFCCCCCYFSPLCLQHSLWNTWAGNYNM